MSCYTITLNFSRELSPNFSSSSERRDSILKNGPKSKKTSYQYFLRVTDVTGVTVALNAASSVTPSKIVRVTGVTRLEVLS